MMEERKYLVKMNYRFNLGSMIDHLWCIVYDIRDGEIETATVLGKQMGEGQVLDLIEEIGGLLAKSLTGKVTGKEYGRIKAISDERNMIRYARCINSGASESEAGYAFFD